MTGADKTNSNPIIYKPYNSVLRVLTHFIWPLAISAFFLLMGFGALFGGELLYGTFCFVLSGILIYQTLKDQVWRCWFDDYTIVVERTFSSETYDISDLKRVWASSEERKRGKGAKVTVWSTHFEFERSNFLSIDGYEADAKRLAKQLTKVYFPIIKQKTKG